MAKNGKNTKHEERDESSKYKLHVIGKNDKTVITIMKVDKKEISNKYDNKIPKKMKYMAQKIKKL